MRVRLEIDLPDDMVHFQLPQAVGARLQALLDRQNSGQSLTALERAEAEGSVGLADLLTLLRLRAEGLQHMRSPRLASRPSDFVKQIIDLPADEQT